MDIIIKTRQELLDFISQNTENAAACNHSKYLGWDNAEPQQMAQFSKVAKIYNDICGNQTNYWGNNAPVELDKYPYCRCDVQRCQKCGRLFFYYEENGWHSPQDRYRLIRPELLIDTALCKYMNLAVPYSLENFFETLQKEIDPDAQYEKSWEGLWQALIHARSLPLELILYCHTAFQANYKNEAHKLAELCERFNRLERKEKITIRQGII